MSTQKVIINLKAKMSLKQGQKKITISQLKKYLPIKPPVCTPKFPEVISRYLLSPSFSNLSIKQQNLIQAKYDIIYRNYFAIEDIVIYLSQITDGKFTDNSIRRAICNSSQKYGIINWYKFIRIIMEHKENMVKKSQEKDKIAIVNKVKQIFKTYLKKRKIWRGVEEVAETKRSLDQKVLQQLKRQAVKQVKQFIERNRLQCENVLYEAQKQFVKTVNFINLQKIVNQGLQMYMDRKKAIYLYLYFDKSNRGFIKTSELLDELLVVKKPKPVKKQTYYLTDFQELLNRIRTDFHSLFYSAHDLENDFDQYYSEKVKQKKQNGQSLPLEDELDPDIFYSYISDKCERRYSRYHIDKVHKNLGFRVNIHFLYNKANLIDLTKFVNKLLEQRKKRRILKKQNEVFYSYRTILLNLITRCKSDKLTRPKLAQFIVDIDPNLMYKSFYCVWRVYPDIINVDRIRKQCKLNPLACYFKLRRTDQQYERMFDSLLEMMPEDATVTYNKLEQIINMNLQFVLDITKIKPLQMDKYDEINYQEAIKKIFDPNFELDIRSYIHRKVSEKTYALWNGYKARKLIKQRAFSLTKILIKDLVPNPKASIDSMKSTSKVRSIKSKSSAKSKQEISMKPQSVEIVKWNIDKILSELNLMENKKRKQFHVDEHIRNYICVNKRQQYEYRTITPRLVMHPIPGLIGIGQNLMFLNKSKQQTIKIKFFFKPGIQIIDFTTLHNDVIILTSYFTLQFYSLAQQSNYSYQTILLLDEVRNINFNDLDNICEDRSYSRFPIFIRTSGKNIFVNTALINNQIVVVSTQTNTIIKKIKLDQRQHILNPGSSKVFSLMNLSARKTQLCSDIIKQFNKQQVSLQAITKLLFNEIQQLQNEVKLEDVSKLKVSCSNVKDFVKNMEQFSTALTICIIKQELNLLKQRKIPQSLTEVVNELMNQMIIQNISLVSILSTIDKQNEGFIKMKSLKDYLQKIAFKPYKENEKEIDVTLKNMAVSKNVDYDIFCQIMSAWKYRVWERPQLIVRDFINVADSNLLIYTLQTDSNVYIKNIDDDLIIAILKGHNCAPSIYFIPQRYLLITGDYDTIRVWRLYEDLVNKYDESPPWEIEPFSVTERAHDAMITSIIYLSRAHHIVTTSLDSTTKFWKINFVKNQLQLEQVKRFYSNEWVYLNSKSNSILLDQDGSRLELLALAKISKQVNENNKHKYQMKIEVFQVESTILKTGPHNIHLQLPPKLKNMLQAHVDDIGMKKKIMLAKTVSQIQNQTMKNNLISENLQKTLYQSVKNCFIFQQFSQIYNICQYLSRKNISLQIVRVLYEKFGVGIPQANNSAPLDKKYSSIIRPEYGDVVKESFINLSEDEIELFCNKLKSSTKIKVLSFEEAISIGSGFLDIVNFEKFENILQDYLNKKETKEIQIDKIISIFQPLKLDSQLDRLYAILRTINILIKQRGLQIWNIFTSNKIQLEKKKKISQSQFQKFMVNLGVSEEKIKLLISYLGKSKSISIDDYIYYTKLAWQVIGFEMNQSNFSKIFMKNSRFLNSKLENLKLDNGIELNTPLMQEKLQSLQSSLGMNKSKTSLGSRKSSKKQLRQIQIISQSNSAEKQSMRDKKGSPNKTEIYKQDGGFSNQISSSNSRLSLSNESNIKDEYTRQIRTIVKKMKELLKNEGKNIWDITSLSVPQFMQNYLITESEYFNILSLIRTPIRLSDKLKLMAYIMKESNQFNHVNLNILFELFDSSQNAQRLVGKNPTQNVIPGQKYIISHFMSKLSENKLILEHCLSTYFFDQKEQLTIEEIINVLSEKPFDILLFCLKEFETLFNLQNKSTFNLEEIQTIIEERVKKYNIKVEAKQITLLEQIIHQIENKGYKLDELLPKANTNNGVINYSTFYSMITPFYKQKQVILQNQFIKIVLHVEQERKKSDKQKGYDSPPKFSKTRGSPKKLNRLVKQPNQQKMIKNSTIKYKQLITYINQMIEQVKNSENNEKDGVKKFLKALQNKKISLLMFFVSLDRNRNYYINQIQFQAGLSELKVNQNFWTSIKKKTPKKLYYFQLINYLVQNQFVNYKCVDSELETAIMKFIRRFIRNSDIESVYDRIRAKDSSQPYNATFTSFQNALKMGNLFSEQQIFYTFAAFANADSLKSSSLSNDNIIKDPTNIHKIFNFKMFTDVINNYKNENITKTPHYKFCHFFKKRGISLLNEYVKWMERNKKVKEIAQAIKLKQYVLPRELYTGFIKQLGTQLQQKQIKQLLSSFPNPLEFSNFNQKLQQIYKKGNSNIQTEQITAYLQRMYKTIKKINVTTHRLFQDFTEDGFKMDINCLTELIKFLELGFTKIQNKLIFSFIDLEKKGYITYNQLQYALQDAGDTIDKDEDEFELEFIIQKLLTNKSKYSLKTSRISYNMDRALIIFANVLTHEEIILLNKSAMQHFKTNELTQKNIEQFIIDKQKEAKAKKDKKYKQLVLNFLKFLKKTNIQSTQAFHYFSKDTGQFTKNKFLLSYQSLGLKATILQINSLYSYLDQAKTGIITLQKWVDKLNMIEYETENMEGVSGEELQVFYKVKLILADIYLIFIRKLFKSQQIAAYFDVNGTGQVTYQQILTSFSELGMHLEQNIEGKLTNYLDKQRSGQILVKNVVYELENCLSSKTKMILQTKTSCIFKQKIHLIQQKQNYFIEKLVNSEHFLEVNQKIQSCILITDFVDVIKDFGIVLGEDEFNDVERNFKLNKENLQLYPLYFMFINIFKSYETTLSTDKVERIRYQKLFNVLIKNGLNLRVFDKIQTIKDVTVFLSQLKIYTPIQIKLMIESVIIPGSNLIDSELLVRKTRDSFLKAGTWFKASLIGEFGSDRILVMKQWLKQQIIPQKVTQILRANSGRINKDTFQSLLLKLDIILKKNDVMELFKIYSKGEDFVLIQNILNNNQKLENEQNSHELVEKPYNNILLDHICKSIDFKGVNLEEAWEKYFTNFGFISESSFYLFLNEIGFDFKQKAYEKVVPLFIEELKKQTKLNQIKASFLQFIMRRQGIHPQKKCRQQKYMIQSQTVENLSRIIHDSTQFVEELQAYTQSHGVNINRIPISIVFGYLKSFVKKMKHSIKSQIREKQIIFYINLLINKNQVNLRQLEISIKALITKFFQKKRLLTEKDNNQQDAVMINVPSATSIQKNSNKRLKTQGLSADQTLKKICQQNFMFSYKSLVQNFETKIGDMAVPLSNMHRLSLNLLIERLLQNDYLLLIKPKLTTGQIIAPTEKNKKLAYLQNHQDFNLKTVPNLIIDKEEHKPEKGIYVINEKYYAMSVSQKKDFQTFAFVSNLLDHNIVFLRAKNYYLWEPNESPMPKQAINFRWKYIPMCLLKMCKQIHLLEEHGYAVPHLRWENINSKAGITKVPYPSLADPMGRIQSINHESLFKTDDPYCPPEVFRKKHVTNLKLNTWIFGCIMYEFIWGHSPHSFILLLLEYIESRHSQYKLAQVLKMEELPSDFRYSPFKFQEIKECLSFEHVLKGQGIPDDLQNNIIFFGLKGLVKTLESLYGKQEMYFRKQFEVLEKMHEIIIDCLDLDPETRPSIKLVVNRLSELLDEQDYRDFTFNEYIQSISEHESVSKLNTQLIDELKVAFLKSDTSSVEQLSKKFHQELIKVSTTRQLKEIYLIPKKYPWPDQESPQIYDQQMLLHRTAIRSHGAYSTICSIQNENTLQMLINLYVEYVKSPTHIKNSAENIFSNILKCLMIIIEMLRTYDSPFAGYVPQILQAFIQLYYRQSFYFTSDVTKEQQKTQKGGLVFINDNGKEQRRALNLIRNIIYLDGSANAEYLPIHHFLLANKQYQLLFQYFYSSVDLVSGEVSQNADRRMLAISYFRDRIYDDYYWNIIKYLKIDLLMLNLLDDHELQLPVLMFFKDMTSFQNCVQFNLFNSNIFYLKLGYLLTQNITSIMEKSLVIQIASNILEIGESKIIKKMNEPSFGMMKQIFKVIIEPPRDTPAHFEYVDLYPALSQFVKAFKSYRMFAQEVDKIEGGQTILGAFENSNMGMSASLVIGQE